MQIKVVDLIFKGELRLIIRLEPLCQLAVARIVIVKIDSDEGLHGRRQYFFVAEDLREPAPVESGLADQEIKKVVHGAHLCLVGEARKLGQHVLLTVDLLELFRLSIDLL